MDHDAEGTTGTPAGTTSAVLPGTRLVRPDAAAPSGAAGALLRPIEALRHAAAELERERAAEVARCAPDARDGARNLLHYVAVRRHDLRPLQDDLARLGLSSLGRMEAHVAATLAAVHRALRSLACDAPASDEAYAHSRFDDGSARLAEHANRVLGPGHGPRATRIMVTLPTEAADDPTLLRDLLEAGTDLVRTATAGSRSTSRGRSCEPARWRRARRF